MDDPLHNQPHACPLLWRPPVRDQPSGPCLPALRRQRQVHLQDRVEREGASDAVAGTSPLLRDRLHGLNRTLAGRRLPEKRLPQHERRNQRGQVGSPRLIIIHSSYCSSSHTLLNAPRPTLLTYYFPSSVLEPHIPHGFLCVALNTCMYEREHRNSSANVMPSCRPHHAF